MFVSSHFGVALVIIAVKKQNTKIQIVTCHRVAAFSPVAESKREELISAE